MPGAIFDWDGVVIASHDQHEESWAMLYEEEGQPMPDDFFKKSFGMRNQTIIPTFFAWVDPQDTERIERLGDRKEVLYRELIRRDGIEPLPGVSAFLGRLKDAGIPCSVGSSTPRENIDTIMEVIGLGGYFDAITAAEDVTEGKPNPQVFLKAAERIATPPADCVVFEDAHVGIRAGRAAGMRVVAVTTTHPRESLGEADLVVERLDELTPADLWSDRPRGRL